MHKAARLQGWRRNAPSANAAIFTKNLTRWKYQASYAANLMVQYIITPWRNCQELFSVRQAFYPPLGTNEATREEEQRKAVALVSVWVQRGNCPHSVESTALLVSAILNEATGNTAYAMRAAYSAAFCRWDFLLMLVDYVRIPILIWLGFGGSNHRKTWFHQCLGHFILDTFMYISHTNRDHGLFPSSTLKHEYHPTK
jgi:hypothetical protein